MRPASAGAPPNVPRTGPLKGPAKGLANGIEIRRVEIDHDPSYNPRIRQKPYCSLP